MHMLTQLHAIAELLQSSNSLRELRFIKAARRRNDADGVTRLQRVTSKKSAHK